MTETAPAESFLPLREVEREVLQSVSASPHHGYAILRHSAERHQGRSGFEIPTLYRALRRMRRQGLIERVEPPADCEDARRTYWAATALGQEVLEAEICRLEAIVADYALGPGRQRGAR